MDGDEHEQRLADQGRERRVHPRYSVDEESLLVLVNHGMPVKTRLVDLSCEGCRLHTVEPFKGKPGWPVEIAFKVKGCDFRFSGIVRRNDGQRLLGIQFVNMIPRRKAELAEVIEEMAETVAARTKTVDRLVAAQAVPAPAIPEIYELVKAKPVEPEAVNASDPEFVTRAIEPPIEASAQANAPAAVAESPANIHAEPAKIPAEIEPPVRRRAKPRDRRGQARQEVDTVATIFLIKVASALRGHIVDLSVGGCRIRTDERFPVGIYIRVEVEFHLYGLPFRLGGVTQAIHNRFMIGIRFLDLSERKREQVLDLIGEIEQMRAALPQDDARSTEKRGQAKGS